MQLSIRGPTKEEFRPFARRQDLGLSVVELDLAGVRWGPSHVPVEPVLGIDVGRDGWTGAGGVGRGGVWLLQGPVRVVDDVKVPPRVCVEEWIFEISGEERRTGRDGWGGGRLYSQPHGTSLHLPDPEPEL